MMSSNHDGTPEKKNGNKEMQGGSAYRSIHTDRAFSWLLLAELPQNLAAAGRCIAVEMRAISGIRLMPCNLVIGLAAGIADSMQFPKYNILHEKLLRENCCLN